MGIGGNKIEYRAYFCGSWWSQDQLSSLFSEEYVGAAGEVGTQKYGIERYIPSPLECQCV